MAVFAAAMGLYGLLGVITPSGKLDFSLLVYQPEYGNYDWGTRFTMAGLYSAWVTLGVALILAASSIAVVLSGKTLVIAGWIAGSVVIAVACTYVVLNIAGIVFTLDFYRIAPRMLCFVALMAFGLAAWRFRTRWNWPLVAAGVLGLLAALSGPGSYVSIGLCVVSLALILSSGILMYREKHGTDKFVARSAP
jgi:hypothetical protein